MKQPTIIEAFESPNLFRSCFKDKNGKDGIETWKSWFILDKVIFGLPLEKAEFEIYKQCTERKKIHKEGYDTIFCICGRRGGKSRNAALVAVYLSLFGGFEKQLVRGQTGYVFLIATDRQQAREILGYCEGILQDAKLENMIKTSRTLDIELTNGITIAVRPASFRATRGYTTVAIILDELAFFRSETSANPISEIFISLLPTLVKRGRIIGISTPYSRFGFLYEQYKKHYGKDKSKTLLWRADTKKMNPTYDSELMARNIELDPIKMRAEYGALWRDDIENFFSEKDIERITMKTEFLPFYPENRYFSFCDSSGGKHDSFSLAIAHLEDKKIIIDCIRETKPPFDPSDVVLNYAEVLRQFNVREITGDRYAAEWVMGSFRKENINYIQSDLTKSDIYIYFQSLVNMHKVGILKSEKLKTQLLLLERRINVMGKDMVDHPRGAHDDIANSVAGVSVLIDRGQSKRATKEELESRLPVTHSRLHPMKNLFNKMRRESRTRMTDQEIKEQEKIKEINRDYKRKYQNDPKREMESIMQSEMRTCPRCRGSGIDFGETCGRCKGKGQVSKYSKPTYM